MRGNPLRFFLLVVCLPLLVPLSGCVVAADLVNADLLSGLGFDPATVVPSEGRLLIAFRNLTQYPASFVAVVSDDTRDPTSNAVTVAAYDVAANDTRIMVVDCPVGIVTPGGAAVLVDGSLVDVAYNGTALTAGTDFLCGYVIEIQVSQTGAGGEAAFEVQIRVLPGR